MLKVRLSKQGYKKNPFFRIVTIDEKRKNRGASIDILGYWHKLRDDVKLDVEKLNYWIDKGAIVSKTVKGLAEKARK
jgi:ribosomal protein S16